MIKKMGSLRRNKGDTEVKGGRWGKRGSLWEKWGLLAKKRVFQDQKRESLGKKWVADPKQGVAQ